MRKVSSLLLTILLPSLVFAQTKAIPRPQPLVFTHVTVIDATGVAPMPDMTVVITATASQTFGQGGPGPLACGSRTRCRKELDGDRQAFCRRLGGRGYYAVWPR